MSDAISVYHAHLGANTLSLTLEAVVFATMRAEDRDTVYAFEQAVAAYLVGMARFELATP